MTSSTYLHALSAIMTLGWVGCAVLAGCEIPLELTEAEPDASATVRMMPPPTSGMDDGGISDVGLEPADSGVDDESTVGLDAAVEDVDEAPEDVPREEPAEPWSPRTALDAACFDPQWGEDGFAGFGAIGGPSLALEQGPDGILFAGVGGTVYALDVSAGAKSARVLSQVTTSWKARNFVLHGDVLYSTTASNKLAIIDVADPSRMRIIEEIPLPYSTVALDTSGDLLVTGASRIVGTFEDPEFGTTPIRQSRIFIYDITTPSRVRMIDDVDITPANILIGDLALDGTRLVVNGGTAEPEIIPWTNANDLRQKWCGGIALFDLTHPEFPEVLSTHVGHHEWPGVYCTSATMGVEIDGDHVFATSEQGIHVYDVSHPQNPTMLRTFRDTGRTYVDGSGAIQNARLVARGVRISGDRIYASFKYAGGQPAAGAVVLDRQKLVEGVNRADDPSLMPHLVYGIPDDADHAVQVGDSIYLAHDDGGLIGIDLNTGERVQVISPASVVYDSVLVGNRMFIADYNTGMLVSDVTSLSSPQFLGVWERPNRTSSSPLQPTLKHIARDDQGHVYLSMTCGGLHVFDGRSEETDFDPIASLSHDSVSWPGTDQTYLGPLAVAGEHVYVMATTEDPSTVLQGERCGTTGGTDATTTSIWVIDVREPTAPEVVRVIPLNSAYDLEVYGDRLFVMAFSSTNDGVRTIGSHIFDISDPASPQLLRDWDLGSALSIAVHGQTAYVGFPGGVVVHDLSDIENPQYLGRLLDTGSARTYVTVDGDVLYVASEQGRESFAYDLALDPQSPTLLGRLPVGGLNINAQDGIVMLATGDPGIWLGGLCPSSP